MKTRYLVVITVVAAAALAGCSAAGPGDSPPANGGVNSQDQFGNTVQPAGWQKYDTSTTKTEIATYDSDSQANGTTPIQDQSAAAISLWCSGYAEGGFFMGSPQQSTALCIKIVDATAR
jgi:predicted small lipoprotein YifL